MRLIDANELKEWIENWVTMNKYYHPYSKSNNIPINEVYAILKQMPAIDTDPIRHGHWISDRLCSTNGGTYGVRRCSNCEYYYNDFGDEWNYCPHCGAKMDEVKNNGEMDKT